jgi:GTP-binding protein
VGKSSLINRILGVKKLVKTSSTPGRTQLINFFFINDAFYFVDLPGYGYAKVPPEVQRKWGPMVETYLKERSGLAAVVVVLDIRRMPNQGDRALMDWLAYYGIPQIPVLTKADKLKRGRQISRRREIADALDIDPASTVLFSAVTGTGTESLWSRLDPYL